MKTLTLTTRLVNKLESGLLNFWLTPASPKPLAVLRIGVASVLLYQAVSLFSSVPTLFGPHGLIEWEALQATGSFQLDVGGPFHLSNITRLAENFGLSAQMTVQSVFGLYIVALLGMLIGCQSRLSAATAFLMHLMLTSTAVATTYGIDQFARIALFYSVVFPVGGCLSIDTWRKNISVDSSVTSRIGIRVLQLHMALMYLATGLHKASGPQWWDGEAIWRAITLPQLATIDLTWLADYPQLLIMIGWATLAAEVGYIIFAWHRRTRLLTVGAIISMHVGIALVLGLVSFAMIMIVLNIAAFLIPAEPEVRCSETAEPATLSFAT